jgi:hypothetical protein
MLKVDVLQQPVITCSDVQNSSVDVSLRPISDEQIAANPMDLDVYKHLGTYTWNRLSQPSQCRELMVEGEGILWGVFPEDRCL